MTNDQEDSFFHKAESIVREVGALKKTSLNLRLPGLTRLPSLDNLPFVTSVSIAGTRGLSLGELAKLTNLRSLSLEFAGAIDLTSIGTLDKLEELKIADSTFKNAEPLAKLLRLEALDLSYTNISDLRPISRLRNLRSINLRGTPVSDLTPLSSLTKLESLNVSRTRVTSLRPIANLESLLKGAKQTGYQYDRHTHGGILYTDAPLEDRALANFTSLRKKERTEAVLRHLQKYPDKDASSEWDEIGLYNLSAIPTPFDFSFVPGMPIQAEGSSANWPLLPHEGSSGDLAKRLGASREIAGGIVEGLEAGEYQVRREYVKEFRRYLAKLPSEPGTGNILLADAAARTLRNLFSAESDILSPGFAASLKTFLEQHIGLRAYYPEIQTFYADVRDGKLSTPLPLDATSKFVRGIKEFTPAVFAPSVSEALDDTSSGDEFPLPKPSEGHPVIDGKISLPPPDPLGEVDPTKARNLAVAATMGKLWKTFLDGQKINQAITAWIDAGQKLKPFVKLIVDWYMNHAGHS